jgi:hypothetical protein
MSFIRLNYLQRINLNFYPGIIHEDELFSAILYIEAERVGRISENYFKRRIRGNSTMTKQFSWKNIEGYFMVYSQLLLFGNRKNGKKKFIIKKIIYHIINPMFYNARTLELKYKIKILAFCIHHNYINYVKIKNITIFLIPSLIRIKSLFIKK